MMKKIILIGFVFMADFLYGMHIFAIKKQMPSIHLAARYGQYEWITKQLKKKRYNLNAQDSVSGLTSLMEAVRAGEDAIVTLLVHHGVNLEIEDHDGRTVLSYAAENYHHNNYCAVVALLLACGANAQHKDKSGKIPHDYDYNGNDLLYADFEAYLDCNSEVHEEFFNLNVNFFNTFIYAQ
jgi:FOG: Ankyrin repeat